MTDEAPIIAHPEQLDYTLAERAYTHTSHFSEKRAKSDQETYANDVNGLYAEMWKLAKTDEQKALLAEEMERYRQNYLKHYGAYLASHANVASWFITGRSNFPVAKMEKRGRWADNKRDAFLEWRTKAREAIKRKVLDARPQEEKDAAEWSAIQRNILGSLHVIHDIDAGRSPYTRSAFVNSIAGKVERLAMNGEVDMVDRSLALVRDYNDTHKKPAISGRHKLWTYGELARQQQAKHDAAAGREPETIAEGGGVEIVANPQADRVQIVFPGKPSEEIRSKLRGEGWNWSPREGAWQRRLTEAAKESAKRITGLGM